jgi:hypothetical protein
VALEGCLAAQCILEHDLGCVQPATGVTTVLNALGQLLLEVLDVCVGVVQWFLEEVDNLPIVAEELCVAFRGDHNHLRRSVSAASMGPQGGLTFDSLLFSLVVVILNSVRQGHQWTSAVLYTGVLAREPHYCCTCCPI